MAIYGYTKNYKLIKPQFNTDTWHDYIYDNLDTIDAVMSAIYASGNWKGFWATNTVYAAGDVIIDQATDTMYKVMIDHTTSESTFAAEQTAHPDYYELWSPNNLAESWATKTDGKVSNTDYSAKAYAISSGLIDDGSAKEWAIGSGAIGNTNEYSAKKYATDAHNDYISLTTNVNVVAVGSNIANVNAVGQSISSVNTVASNVSSVNTVAGVSTDVTAVAGIASSVPTVANNDANITTVATNISDVNTAASNMAAIQAAPTAATNAAQSAAQAANSATISANSATDSANSASASANSASNSHIWAEGTDAQVQALGGVHSSKVWAEQSTNANISLTNSPYTTNRILEIPQDIKLELNNGTLTLKAGSKVYALDGSSYTIPSDKTLSYSKAEPHSSWILVKENGEMDDIWTIESASNISIGSKWVTFRETNYYLPICVATHNADGTTKTGWKSIDQVFNGFGYIGSTVFIIKDGIKVQKPNGRNSDGTCRSSIVSHSGVVTQTFTDTTDILFDVFVAEEQTFCLRSPAGETLYYDSERNLMIDDGLPSDRFIIGKAFFKGGKCHNITPLVTDSVANSNASNFSQAGRSYLSGLSMPSDRYVDLTLGASGATYTAPANGWFVLLTSGLTYLDTYRSSDTFGSISHPNNAFAREFVPMQKGQSLYVYYEGTPTNTDFRFYYAEGDNNV